MSKSKQTELDVDFIGGQEPLTQEEQLVISIFFANQKNKKVTTKLTGRKKSKKPIRA